MKLLVSTMALAIALAWPSVGGASSKKSTASGTTTTQQKQVKRQKSVTRTRQVQPRQVQTRQAQRPCAGYLWWGCVGWDPDPRIRSTLVRDLADTP